MLKPYFCSNTLNWSRIHASFIASSINGILFKSMDDLDSIISYSYVGVCCFVDMVPNPNKLATMGRKIKKECFFFFAYAWGK